MVEAALCINFHQEGLVAYRSSVSASVAVQSAKEAGIPTALVAVLDRPDSRTRRIVLESGVAWDEILETDYGDLGGARNAAVDAVDARFISFGDGDDLTGADWVVEAYKYGAQQADDNFVLHPEYVYYFAEWDFDVHSVAAQPSSSASSFFLRHKSSVDPTFDDRLFWFNNLYTSNALAPRSLLVKRPLPERCLEHGFGVEDWTWNAWTTWTGIRHLVVEDTVHLVRLKRSGSLGAENLRLGLLPDLQGHGCRKS
jgi:hypothetical protein